MSYLYAYDSSKPSDFYELLQSLNCNSLDLSDASIAELNYAFLIFLRYKGGNSIRAKENKFNDSLEVLFPHVFDDIRN